MKENKHVYSTMDFAVRFMKNCKNHNHRFNYEEVYYVSLLDFIQFVGDPGKMNGS